MTDVWAAETPPLTPETETGLLALLPPARRQRLSRLREPERRREPLWAYALLALALEERYGWRTLPEMAVTAAGKPFFSAWPGVHFSISHTRGAVLAAVSDQPVGVDVERIRPVRPRTMRQVADTDCETEFFRAWVRREARTKLRGTGIGAMLRREPPLEPGERYQEVALLPGCLAGTATLGDDEEDFRARLCPPETLLAAARRWQAAL